MELLELSLKVDQYYAARADRFEAQKHADSLKKTEDLLQEEIIRALIGAEMKAGSGKSCIVTLQRKDKPICGDWPKLYEYIHDNGAFDLLQKRLGEGAVKLRWEDGIQIPGVESFPVFSLSISKTE